MTKQELINVNKLTPEQMEALQNEMNTRRFKELKETTEDLDKRLTKVEVETPVSSSTSFELTRKRRSRVISWLGGKESKAYKYRYAPSEDGYYKTLSGKTFAEMERDFKDYFKINNYGDLPKKSKEEAEIYIANWEPNTNTKIEIKNVNNQLELLSKEGAK